MKNTILGTAAGVVLGSLLFIYGTKEPSQVITINKDLTLSKDTVFYDEVRFQADSLNREIKISFFMDKVDSKPYQEYHLYAPQDILDISLKDGVNVVKIKELGALPVKNTRIILTKLPESK